MDDKLALDWQQRTNTAAQVDVKIEWTDEEGLPREWTGTATFPNDLQLVPVAWVRGEIDD